MIALTTYNDEASWLRCLLAKIPLWEKLLPYMLIHCDSTASITMIVSHFYKGKRRQIRRKHNTINELLSNGEVIVDFVRTYENLVDPLTKGLTK